MNCPDFHRLRPLADWLPPSLSVPLQARLAAHAAQCAHCRDEARQEEALPGMLRRAYEEQVSAYVAPQPLPAPALIRTPTRPVLRLGLVGATCGAAALAIGGAAWLYRPRPVATGITCGVTPAPAEKKPVPGADPRMAQTVLPQQNAASAVVPGAAPLSVQPTPAAPNHAKGVIRAHPAPNAPDGSYLDGRDPRLAASFLGAAEQSDALRWFNAHVPPTQDDFVHLPLPQLAAGDGKGAGEAVRQYEEEAKVVDARLFHKVTLSCKALPLEELCAQLSEQTGVKIQTSRTVRDEKVTVLVEERPAREVMREVARLFGFMFSRTGEPNSYRYTLEQDLRSQLAEDELRNRDVHEALIALDEQMGRFRPFLEQSIDRMIARVDQNQDGKDGEANLLFRFVKGGGWGPAQLYFRLSPAERNDLLAGKRLRYTLNDSDPNRRLPREWRDSLLKSSGLRLFPTGVIIENLDRDKPSQPINEVPGAEPSVTLSLNRSEAGEIALWVGTSVTLETPQGTSGGGAEWEMAKGRNPSARPDNAQANVALKNLPLFQPKITLAPEPSCPRLAEDEARKKRGEVDPDAFILEAELKEPHVNSADVWTEIHRRTHLPIVADAYTRIYPASQFKLKEQSTFDALCQAGDELGARWRKDGDFLLCRSTSYFWDKLKEVPARALRAWQADRDRNGGLPLEDLMEMASLSDQQLGSKMVGLGITHCWGLDEWGIIGGGPFIGGEIIPEEMRKRTRGLSLLTPAQLAQARKPEGLSPRDVLPNQEQAALEKLDWPVRGENAARLHVEYVPRGRYVWQPTVTRERYEAEAKHWPHVSAATREEALAQARKWDPGASSADLQRTRGRLDLIYIKPNGEWIGQGGPRVLAPLQ